MKASNGHPTSGRIRATAHLGSLLTLEHTENYKKFAYDKAIMMAGVYA